MDTLLSTAGASHRGARARLLFLWLIAAAAAACTSESPASSAGTDAAADSASGQVCAWAVRADKQTLNVAYPDTAATYWGLSYNLAPGETLELSGAFPAARYASFVSYKPSGGVIGVLTDRDIEPDAGSVNPFANGGGAGGEHGYTVVVSAEDGDQGQPNVLAARATPSDAGGPATAPSLDAGVTRVLGSGGANGTGGTVLYRVYVSDDPVDPKGGAGLPDVTLVDAAGHRRAIPTCDSPGPSPVAVALVDKYGPSTSAPAPASPVFIRPGAQAANLFPNPDNVYIATIVEHQPGRIVVVRGKAPTFPDPPNGRPVGSGEQVRYWSLCTDEYRKPYPVSFCVFDRNVALDSAGQFTFVISTPVDRPTNATTASGATWLDWGSTDVNNLLLLRHMLAATDFPESAVNVSPGALASSTMGAYAPRGAYCDKAVFEQGGAAACGL